MSKSGLICQIKGVTCTFFSYLKSIVIWNAENTPLLKRLLFCHVFIAFAVLLSLIGKRNRIIIKFFLFRNRRALVRYQNLYQKGNDLIEWYYKWCINLITTVKMSKWRSKPQASAGNSASSRPVNTWHNTRPHKEDMGFFTQCFVPDHVTCSDMLGSNCALIF